MSSPEINKLLYRGEARFRKPPKCKVGKPCVQRSGEIICIPKSSKCNTNIDPLPELPFGTGLRKAATVGGAIALAGVGGLALAGALRRANQPQEPISEVEERSRSGNRSGLGNVATMIAEKAGSAVVKHGAPIAGATLLAGTVGLGYGLRNRLGTAINNYIYSSPTTGSGGSPKTPKGNPPPSGGNPTPPPTTPSGGSPKPPTPPTPPPTTPSGGNPPTPSGGSPKPPTPPTPPPTTPSGGNPPPPPTTPSGGGSKPPTPPTTNPSTGLKPSTPPPITPSGGGLKPPTPATDPSTGLKPPTPATDPNTGLKPPMLPPTTSYAQVVAKQLDKYSPFPPSTPSTDIPNQTGSPDAKTTGEGNDTKSTGKGDRNKVARGWSDPKNRPIQYGSYVKAQNKNDPEFGKMSADEKKQRYLAQLQQMAERAESDLQDYVSSGGSATTTFYTNRQKKIQALKSQIERLKEKPPAAADLSDVFRLAQDLFSTMRRRTDSLYQLKLYYQKGYDHGMAITYSIFR